MSHCPQCTVEVGPGDRFCHNCACDLHENPPVSAPSPTPMMTISADETIDADKTTGTLGRRTATEQVILEPGTMFAARYKIGALLGKGGMGAVYAATDEVSGEEVAIKIIRSDRVQGEKALRRLIEEGTTARSIRHPNVIAVHTVELNDGQPFIVMEKLQGKSLRAWHREQLQARRDVPFKVAARIIAEILDGLSAAHARGIVHRDMKPENVFIIGAPTAERAEVRILDFGIASAVDAQSATSGTGSTAGTMGYMAPEQENNADLVGPEADVYAVTVMFYELLMQNRPSARWKQPSGARPDVPAGMDRLFDRGLDDYPKSRPANAKAYLEELQKVGEGNWLSVIKGKYDDNQRKQSHRWAPMYKAMGFEWEKGQPFRYTRRNWIALGVWSAVFMVVLSALGAGASIMNGAFSGSGSGYAYDNSGRSDFIDDDDDDDDIRPVTPQRPSGNTGNYSSLSGNWYGTDLQLRTTVTSGGNFRATGYVQAAGVTASFSGGFSGGELSAVISAPGEGNVGTLRGTMQSDGRHIAITIYDGYGNAVAQDRFCINHSE